MLRKDREITDFKAIVDVLERCDTLRLGLFGSDYPYVVPLSFGMCVEENKVTMYFHGGPRGYKTELLAKNPQACVEGDIFLKVEPTEHGITTRYESVIGFGKVEPVTGEEIITGLQSIVDHYGFSTYQVKNCQGFPAVRVYKMVLTQITGKHNLK